MTTQPAPFRAATARSHPRTSSRGVPIFTALAAAFLLGTPLATSAEIQWLGGAVGDENNFNNADNWVGGSLPVLYNEVTNSPNGDVVVFDGENVLVDNKLPVLTGPYGSGNGNGDPGSDSETWGLQGLKFVDSGWTLDTGENTLFLSHRGSTDLRSEATSGINTINGNIRFGSRDTNDQSDVFVAAGGTLRLNSSIGVARDGGGNLAGGLSKYGAGLLELNTTGTLGSAGLKVYDGTVRLFSETVGSFTGTGNGGIGTNYQNALSIFGGTLDLNGAAPSLTATNLILDAGAVLTNSSDTMQTFTMRPTSSRTLGGQITGNLNMVFASAPNGSSLNTVSTLTGSSSYTGTTAIANANGTNNTNTIVVTQDVMPGEDGPLGNSTTAIALGSDGNSSTHSALLTNGEIEIGRDITLAAASNASSIKTLGAASTQVGDSEFSGTITVGRAQPFQAGGGSNLTVTSPTDVTVHFTGDIVESPNVGDGKVNKTGDGTVRFAGNNTYAGGTTITAGVLIVDNAAGSGTGTGDVAVLANATLGGGNVDCTTGFIAGNVTLAADAHLAPGQSAGTLTLEGGLTLADTGGSILDFELGGPSASDLLSLTGGIFTGNSSGFTLITIAELGGFGAGTYTLIDWTGATLSGVELADFQLANSEYSGGATGSLQIVGNQLQLAVVPEPGAAALLGLGAAAFLFARPRRR